MNNTVVVDKIVFPDADFKIKLEDKAVSFDGKGFHEEIEIKYCYEGCFNMLIDAEVYTVRAGDVVVVNPYEIHKNIDIVGSNAKYYMINVDLDAVSDIKIDVDLRKELIVGKKKFKNIIRGDERLPSIIKCMAEETREKREYYQLAERGLLEQLTAILLRDHINYNVVSGTDGKIKQKQTIIPALTYIHNEYANKITVEALAEACCMSVSNFARTFKAVMHLTPIQYVLAYRINIAEMLLFNTSKSCEEIAEICGFEDPAYFNKCYKKMRGDAPNRARKKRPYFKTQKSEQ